MPGDVLMKPIRLVRIVIAVTLLIALLSPALVQIDRSNFQVAVAQGATSKEVVVINFNVQVDSGSSSLFSRAVSIAKADGAAAIMIDENTPGGLVNDMLLMINSISDANASGIPVYAYIGNDSLAASAGSYIAMATNRIFMGPGSQIGPSTPIVVGGTSLEQNHTAGAMLSLMTSLAEAHGRNTTAAFQMVVNDIAYSYSQALAYHIADQSSNSLSQTLQDLNLSGATVVTVSENLPEQLVSFLSNPTVDGILFLIGIVAITLDFLHPTVILSVAGLVLIALALIGAEAIQGGATSSAIAVPLVLFAAAAALIVFEIKTGHGFMMFAGVVVGAFATLLLAYQVPYSPSPFGDVQFIELGILVIIGGLLALYARWVVGAMKRKPYTGVESLVGKSGSAVSDLGPEGEVSIDGIIWKARLAEGAAKKGDHVVVKQVTGLTLVVERESIKERHGEKS
ncbi:MAG: nodulation protein NfeD [Bacteroidetes bacterium]|nr:nodulation protein NfeD [Bacteroidota bacterium]